MGVAYHDSTPGNSGGAGGFRSGESIGVDVSNTGDLGGARRIVNTIGGEYLEYTLNVTAGGLYTLEFRVASNADGAKFFAEIDGTAVTGQILIPNTGGDNIFTTVAEPDVPLAAGPHILRLTMDIATASGSAGVYNFITIRPASQSTGTFSLTPARTRAVPKEHTQLSLAWTVPTGGWRVLTDVEIRLRDKQGIVLWIKFDEAANTLSLFNPASGRFGPARAVGSSTVLSNKYATLYLRTSSVQADGPTAPTVVLTFDISFKSSTEGRHFRVEAAASDDLGHAQPFELAGFLHVARAGTNHKR